MTDAIVIISGYAAEPAKLIQTPTSNNYESGKSYNFRIGVRFPYLYDNQWESETEWFGCTAWNVSKSDENVILAIQTGSYVNVTGVWSKMKYIDKTGEEKFLNKLKVISVQLCHKQQEVIGMTVERPQNQGFNTANNGNQPYNNQNQNPPVFNQSTQGFARNNNQQQFQQNQSRGFNQNPASQNRNQQNHNTNTNGNVGSENIPF
ncbi:single-stranded DNA-binding protein [Psittacicella hinzii]|uniref:Single-stranded DNA-binding protein n=1 Tax=Psittacicella hinzii TaxID=2028575 RepID=A0A3A1YAX5_9GAMM|nr:single-stranded DNA-binding protein [Psittacicella hinzii]RIY35282.1 hypothetical protein CKF58_06810 [Psittacicella hinzii]